MSDVFASAPFTVGKSLAVDAEAHIPTEESLCRSSPTSG